MESLIKSFFEPAMTEADFVQLARQLANPMQTFGESGKLEKVKNFFKELFEKIKKFLKYLIKRVKNFFKSVNNSNVGDNVRKRYMNYMNSLNNMDDDEREKFVEFVNGKKRIDSINETLGNRQYYALHEDKYWPMTLKYSGKTISGKRTPYDPHKTVVGIPFNQLVTHSLSDYTLRFPIPIIFAKNIGNIFFIICNICAIIKEIDGDISLDFVKYQHDVPADYAEKTLKFINSGIKRTKIKINKDNEDEDGQEPGIPLETGAGFYHGLSFDHEIRTNDGISKANLSFFSDSKHSYDIFIKLFEHIKPTNSKFESLDKFIILVQSTLEMNYLQRVINNETVYVDGILDSFTKFAEKYVDGVDVTGRSYLYNALRDSVMGYSAALSKFGMLITAHLNSMHKVISTNNNYILATFDVLDVMRMAFNQAQEELSKK